ncbi:hypothetical protein AB0885_44155, partial [Streptomyces sp. NPDC005534]
ALLAQVNPRDLSDMARALPLPETLEALVRSALQSLPDDSQRLAEGLAVLDVETPLGIAGNVAGLDNPSTALGPLLATGLAQWNPAVATTPVRLSHPLQSKAVYSGITPIRRKALHTAVAALVDHDTAWRHLVAAADHADPDLADQLVAESIRQAQQGRFGRAATLDLWSANLVLTREMHEQRLLDAATHLLTGWLYQRALTLEGAIQDCAPGSRRDAVLGRLSSVTGNLENAVVLLQRAFQNATDPAVRGLVGSWLGAAHTLRCDGPAITAALTQVVDQLPPGLATAQARGQLAIAAAFTHGPLVALQLDGDLPSRAADVPREMSLYLGYRGEIRIIAGKFKNGIEDIQVLDDRRSTDSNLPFFCAGQAFLGLARFLTGRFDDALISVERTLATADACNQPWAMIIGHSVAACAAAWCGRWDQAEAHLAACRPHSDFRTNHAAWTSLSEAILAQAHADHKAMIGLLRGMEPGVRRQDLAILWAPRKISSPVRRS